MRQWTSIGSPVSVRPDRRRCRGHAIEGRGAGPGELIKIRCLSPIDVEFATLPSGV